MCRPLTPEIHETAETLQALVDRYGPITRVDSRGCHTWLDFRYSLDSHPLPLAMASLIAEAALSLYPNCKIVRP